MCCRLCIEAHTNRLAGVFKLAKRSLHVKSQVKQYIYPPAFCKMMMNNLKRCNINLIIITYSFWIEIYSGGAFLFFCLYVLRHIFSIFKNNYFFKILWKVKTVVFKDRNAISESILTHFAQPWSKPGFDTYQTKVY